MKNKFYVKDESGKEFVVEEKDCGIVENDIHDEDEEEIEEIHDAEPLTEEEISALKGLAAVADKLIALLKIEKEEHAGEEEASALDEEIEEPITDAEEEEELEENKVHDSKKSFGSIEKAKANIDDSLSEDEVSNAWAKRYGGK